MRRWKRSAALLMALVLCASLVLSACGSSGGASSSSAAAPGATEAPAATQAPAASAAETAAPEPAEDVHINVCNLYGLSKLDPHDGWNGWYSCRLAISECLVTVNENIELVPQLADSWERTGELTYSFHIRQGVKFSNGNDLTAEGVKASFERLMGMTSRLADLKIDSIEVDGENVIFTTTEPYSAFPNVLSEPMCSIVDVSADDGNFNEMPVCTGPYKVIEYVADEKVELEANEYYWDGVPAIRYITALNIGEDTKVDAMLAGQIDVGQGANAITLSALEGQDRVTVVEALGSRIGMLQYNCAPDHPTSDLNLRLALSYALNRDVIAQIDGNGYSYPAATLFAASYGSEGVDTTTYDPDKAAEYLELAGYTDSDGNGYVDRDGEELVLDMPLSSTESTAIQQAMQDMWREAKIHVELRMVENKTPERDEGRYDIYDSFYQTLNAGDGQTFLRNNFGSPDAIGRENNTHYASADFDAILAELDQTDDPAGRLALFMKAQQQLAADMPWFFMYLRKNVYMVNANVVDPASVVAHPIDYYFITNKWLPAQG